MIQDRPRDSDIALMRESVGALERQLAWLDAEGLDRVIVQLCNNAGIATDPMPMDLRRRDTATHRFLFNYGPDPVTHDGVTLQPADLNWTPL